MPLILQRQICVLLVITWYWTEFVDSIGIYDNGIHIFPLNEEDPSPKIPLNHNFLNAITGCCPDGWFVYHGSCYLFVQTSMTYGQAADYCHWQMGSLVVVNSMEEEEIILERAHYNSYHWIGYSGFFSKIHRWESREGGIDIERLFGGNWMVSTGAHGFIANLNSCGSYRPTNHLYMTPSYYHFHNCMQSLPFVCERNDTSTSPFMHIISAPNQFPGPKRG